MHQVTVKRQLFDQAVGLVQHRHSRRLIYPAALHPHEPVLDHVDPPHAVAAGPGVQFLDHLQRAVGLPVDRNRHTRLESDLQRLLFVGGILGRDGHAEVDQFDSVGLQIFQLTRLVADVQAVLIRTVRFLDRRLHRDALLLAEGDHLGPARKQFTEPFDPPRRNQLDTRIERFGCQLEPALVVALAGGSVSIRIGPDIAGHLQADLGNQRACDRRAQQVRPLVAGLPLQNREGEVAAEFLLGVNDLRRDNPLAVGLLENLLAVLARLAQVDIHRVHVVALVLQPSENHRRVQATRIRQHTTGHCPTPLQRSTANGDRGTATHPDANWRL